MGTYLRQFFFKLFRNDRPAEQNQIQSDKLDYFLLALMCFWTE